jgi:hypothetical protein
VWTVQAAPPLLPWQDILGLAERLSGAVIAFLFFIGLSRGWWVMRTEFEEMRRQRDYWQQMYREERAARQNRSPQKEG